MNPEVKFVLDAIEQHLVGGGNSGAGFFGAGHDDLSDVPLERIDRDHSVNLDKAGGLADLDGPIHEHSADLEGMNYVGASSAGTTSTPIGTAYDHRDERVVGVRIEGVHASEYGAIDPYAGTEHEKAREYPTCRWDDLVQGIRWSILRERTWPDTGRPNVAFTDLQLTNESDVSRDWADYYRYDLDVVLSGFEDLP